MALCRAPEVMVVQGLTALHNHQVLMGCRAADGYAEFDGKVKGLMMVV